MSVQTVAVLFVGGPWSGRKTDIGAWSVTNVFDDDEKRAGHHYFLLPPEKEPHWDGAVYTWDGTDPDQFPDSYEPTVALD